jgi:hypothetical protein
MRRPGGKVSGPACGVVPAPKGSMGIGAQSAGKAKNTAQPVGSNKPL